MIGRLIMVGGVVLVGLAVLPGINTFLTDITEEVLAPISTDFEIAFWQLVPVLLFIYFLVVLPLYYLLGGLRKKKDRDDEL